MSQLLIYLPLIKWLIVAALVIWKHHAIGEFIYSCLGAPGKVKTISSKRVIAISGMGALIYCIVRVVDAGKALPEPILWALVIIIITAAAIATMPEIYGLIREIKGIIPTGGPEAKGEAKNEEVQP